MFRLMIQAAVTYVKDPFRIFALACWAGAFGLTLLLIVLASEAVHDARHASEQIEQIRAGQAEQMIAQRKPTR